MSDVSDFLGFHPGSRRPAQTPPVDVQREEFHRGHGTMRTPTANTRREGWRGFEISQRPTRVEANEMFAYEPDPELDEILVGWTAQQLGWVFTPVPQECILCAEVHPDLMEHVCRVYQVLEQLRVDDIPADDGVRGTRFEADEGVHQGAERRPGRRSAGHPAEVASDPRALAPDGP